MNFSSIFHNLATFSTAVEQRPDILRRIPRQPSIKLSFVTHRLNLLWAMLIASVVLSFTYLQLPGNTLFWQSLQNSGHSIVFAGLAVVTMYSVMRLRNTTLTLGALLAGSSLFAVGLIIEMSQQAIGRGASLQDLVFNFAGIVCGLSAYAVGQAFLHKKAHKPATWLVAIVGVAAIAWSLKLPMTFFVTSLQRPSLPTLTNFENPGAYLYVGGAGSTHQVAQHSEWEQNRSQSVKVTFETGRWPNVSFKEPLEDWSNYSSITFTVFNPSDKAISMRIRIDDRSLGDLNDDHTTVSQNAPAGVSIVRLDFELFKDDAQNRNRPGLATFEKIRQFMVFLPAVESSTTLYFDDFFLE